MSIAQCHPIATCRRLVYLGRWLQVLVGMHIPASLRRVLSPVIALAIFATSSGSIAQSGRLDLVLLIDNAIAIETADAEQRLRDTLADFVRASDSATHVAVISYDDLAFPIVPLTRITPAGREAVLDALSNLDFNAPNSNIAAGLERAIYEFDRNGHESADRRILMIHSGGIRTGDFEQDQSFRRWTMEVLAPKAARMSIRVQNLSFSAETDVELAQKIADLTGGVHTQVRSHEDLITQLNRMQSAIFATNASAPSTSIPPMASGSASSVHAVRPTPGSNQISDESGFTATETIAGINRLNRVDPTQAGAALPSDPASPSRRQVNQVSNEPTAGQSATRGNSTTGQQSAILWIVIGVLAVGMVAALIAFVVMRQRNKQLSASQVLTSGKPGVRLVDLSGVSGRSTYTISDKLVRVCRTPGRDSYNVVCITIPDDVISREHAFIEYRDRDYFVTDRNSDNGTYVNGRQVTSPRKLEDGDRIRFATFEFAFERPAADAVRNAPNTSAGETTAITFNHDQADTASSSGGLTLVRGSKGQNHNAIDERVETGSDSDSTRLSDRTLVR